MKSNFYLIALCLLIHSFNSLGTADIDHFLGTECAAADLARAQIDNLFLSYKLAVLARDSSEIDFVNLNNQLADQISLLVNRIDCATGRINSYVNSQSSLIKQGSDWASQTIVSIQSSLTQIIKAQNEQFAYLSTYTVDPDIVPKIELLIKNNPSLNTDLQALLACVKTDQYNSKVFVKNVIVREATMQNHLKTLSGLANNKWPSNILQFNRYILNESLDISSISFAIRGRLNSYQAYISSVLDDIKAARMDQWVNFKNFNKVKDEYIHALLQCRNEEHVVYFNKIIKKLTTCNWDDQPCNYPTPTYPDITLTIPPCEECPTPQQVPYVPPTPSTPKEHTPIELFPIEPFECVYERCPEISA